MVGEVGSRDARAVAARAFLRDGAALSASALLTAVVGLVGWVLAARFVAQAEVGYASAFVTSMILVASLSELALGPALLRWIPRAGADRLLVVARSYAVAVALAAVGSVVAVGVLLATLREATGAGLLGTGLLFGVAATTWAVFHLQDEVLTGLGAARWVLGENLAFAVLRIGLLLALAPALGVQGVVLSWVVPTVVMVLVVNGALLRRARRTRDHGPGARPSRPDVVRLLAPLYPASVATAVAANLVPLLVTSRFGAETGAVFFVVWMGLNALDLALTGFGNAIVVRLGSDDQHPGAVLLRATVRLLPLVLLGLAVAFAVAPVLLGLFGPAYVDAGTELLRWVLVGFVARTVVLLAAGAFLGTGHGARTALVQVTHAAAVVAVAAVVPTSAGLAELGLGYVLAQVGVLLLVLLLLLRAGVRAPAEAGGRA